MHCVMRKLTNSISRTQFRTKIVGFRSYCSNKVVVDIGQPTPASHPKLLKDGEITPGISSDEYIERRKKLLDLLPEKSLAIIAAAPVKMMTDVVPYTFRQDADYLYITGCQQPGGVAVLGHDIGLCMFMPEVKPYDVTWQGQIAGVEAALDTFKADKAYPMRKLREILPDMLRGSSKLFHNTQTATSTYTELEAFQKLVYCNNVRDLSVYTHQLRWIKSPAELKLMKEAASIACQALLLTMLHSKTYPFEGMLAAKVEYECRMRGAQRMGFNPVVGGGPNASVIHYSRNDQKIKQGDLVLMDVGCELHGYVSDLTRTWPPCGSFSSSQSMLLLDAFNKDRASLPQPLPNPPPLAPIPVAAPDPRTQEMINEKLKKAEDLGEQGKVDEAQKALEEAEVLKKCQLPTRQEPVVDNSILQNIQLLICELLIRSYVYVTYVEYF